MFVYLSAHALKILKKKNKKKNDIQTIVAVEMIHGFSRASILYTLITYNEANTAAGLFSNNVQYVN